MPALPEPVHFSTSPPKTARPEAIRLTPSTSLPPIRRPTSNRRYPDKPRVSFDGHPPSGQHFARTTSLKTITPSSSFTESPPPSPRSIVHAVPSAAARATIADFSLRDRPPSPRPTNPASAAILRGKQWMIWSAASRRSRSAAGQRFRRTSFTASACDAPKKKRRHATNVLASVVAAASRTSK